MKKTLVGLSAGLLTLSAFSCDWGAKISAKNDNNSAARHPANSQFRDGDYMFYFKNGNRIHRDIDGYDLGDDVKTYDFFNKDVRGFSGQLDGAGIAHEKHETGTGSLNYGWNKFSASNLIGIGYENPNANSMAIEMWLKINNGNTIYATHTWFINYIRAGGTVNKLYGEGDGDLPEKQEPIKRVRKAMEGIKIPTLLIETGPTAGGGKKFKREHNKFLSDLKTNEVSVLYDDQEDFIVIDAANIDLFWCNTYNWS